MWTSRTPLAAGLLAGALLLTACGGDSGTQMAPPSAASAAPSSPAAPTSEEYEVPGAGQEPGAMCNYDALTAALGETTGEAGQRHTIVVWTNGTTTPCTMTGFGGVDLQGPDDPMGPTYSLPRAEKEPATVDLGPGDTAHTTITWLPPQDGSGWTPTELVVTPPDETRSFTLDWPGGAVLRQDGATRPGTYIDPVAPGNG
ncbi:DUF4232 domain-containing protein [Pseudonocardia nematodicida]|uniref:DUF4232 domain-containing protein n=1 Tax=Pseudonocardia nematodicida TaxID=1206997 RepID=A0ABV1KF86_9PSEU